MPVEPDIGIATIYRTIHLLVNSGILIEHTFGEKKGFYEVNSDQNPEHGHLICTVCGKIVEFQIEHIEMYKERLNQKYDFKIQSHKLEFFGICPACQQK